MKCIFDEYVNIGKECDRDYKCIGCKVHNDLKLIVKVILLNDESDNKSSKQTNAA